MKRIYIAGPMTGKPDLNRAEFRRAQVYLQSLCGRDFFIVNPHEQVYLQALCGRDFFIVNPHEVAKENGWTEDTELSCIADGLLYRDWETDRKSVV